MTPSIISSVAANTNITANTNTANTNSTALPTATVNSNNAVEYYADAIPVIGSVSAVTTTSTTPMTTTPTTTTPTTTISPASIIPTFTTINTIMGSSLSPSITDNSSTVNRALLNTNNRIT